MPVTFVIGRAGTGKTHRIFHAIVELMRQDPLGPPIYWLLPRQATFSVERELTCGSGLPGFARTRVVSFEEFGRDVFADCGGISIPEVTPLGRQMILGHLLRRVQPELRFFTGVARQTGLAAELDQTFEELERAGKDGSDLARLADELEAAREHDPHADPLLAKLHDLSLLYRRYTDYLGQERLDQHRRTRQVLASLGCCSLLKRAAVYVDGFLEFTDYERRFLAGVAKAGAAVEITLLLDPDSATLRDPHSLPLELSLFHRAEEAYRRLHFAFADAGIAVNPPVLLREARRYTSPALAHLERSAFAPQAAASEESASLTLIQAPDRRAEADAIARTVRAHLARGVRLRDIVVLVRDLAAYHAPLEASFAEHNLPLFLDRRRTAAHHPLLQTLRAMIRVARSDWPHDAIMTLLKGGLVGIDLLTADGVENYVLVHRLFNGAAWRAPVPWAYRRRLTTAEGEEAVATPDEAEKVRALLAAALAPLEGVLHPDATLPLRQIAAGMFGAFERLGIRNELSKWTSEARAVGQIEQSQEHEQVWTELISLFEQMVDLLGDEPVTPADFIDILESGLERFDLALTPATVDQVLLGQIDRTRSPNARVVFIAGMNEGEFPAAPRDHSLLTDRERRELGQRKFQLDAGLHRRQLDERLLGYLAMTRASDRLYLSRSASDASGKVTAPSQFWQSVQALFPNLEITSVESCGEMEIESIATPRQLVTSLMRWARSSGGPMDAAQTPWPALYHWLAGRPCDDGEFDVARYHAWKALSYRNEAHLSAELRAGSHSKNGVLSASPSELETFAACPFRHFLRYELQLGARADHDVGPQDLGRVYHVLLDRLVDGALRAGRSWDSPGSPPIDAKTIRAASADMARALRDDLNLASARNRYLLGRVESMLERFVAFQQEMLRRGKLRPAFTAVTYGHGGRMGALELTTPAGARLQLHGKIDRIDIEPDTGQCTVLDYKLGPAALSLGQAFWGISVQLLSALLALRANGRELAGRELDPIGAFYLRLIRRIEDVKHPDEALPLDDPARRLATPPRGIFDTRAVPVLDSEFTVGSSQVVKLFVKKDGQLGNRHQTDAAETDEIEALLQHVRERLGQLADEILAGHIDIAPYRLNRLTPCPHCEYRSICRFETPVNHYRMLHTVGRETVFVPLTTGAANAKRAADLNKIGGGR